jgi:cytochrome c
MTGVIPRRITGRYGRSMTSARRARLLAAAALALSAALATACSPDGSETAKAAPAAAPVRADGLTDFQVQHGIGPITAPVAVGATVDAAMAKSGSAIFEQKCAACHKMGERYVGPALGTVTTRRSPAFVMNMVLNPAGMVQKHPETKKLLAEFFVPMPNQGLTEAEARKVVEYLRSQAH